MPTRRTMALMVIVVVAIHPVIALTKVWATRSLGSSPSGSVQHGAAEIVSVVA